MSGGNEVALAGQLAGFGARLEVFEPVGIRTEMARIAAELAAIYAVPALDPEKPEAVGHSS